MKGPAMPSPILLRLSVSPSRSPLALLSRLRVLIALRRQRSSLARLDDHLLRDIGLTPETAKAEADRPLWDVPARWRS
jgi:uncharacterized protein YjiS (DUF1127 family)